MPSCVPGTVLGFKHPAIRHLACPYQSTHVPHKKEEWKLGSKREYPGTEWNTPNFLWYKRNFLLEYTSWILCPETKSISFCANSQIQGVWLGWGQTNVPRECLHLLGFLLPNTHFWHTHLAAIWNPLPPKRGDGKCSIRFYYPLLEEKWHTAWMFPKRMLFMCSLRISDSSWEEE